MTDTSRSGPGESHPWPLILCLVGVDYFSTLAYLPSIAVEAAGPLAPIAAGTVVLATFLLALPVYWYVVGRSTDGRGATGILEDSIPGWRGKFVVLTLLGFAAADFVITRSLSLADAAIHIIQNPHGNRLLARLPDNLIGDGHILWPPLAHLLRRVLDPQVAITLGLSVISFALWQLFKHGVNRRMLLFAAVIVGCYLTLTAIVIGSALVHITKTPDLWNNWLDTIFRSRESVFATSSTTGHGWIWAWLSVALWSFPQMALGLSGFEMIMTVVPRVSSGSGNRTEIPQARTRSTRKLMVVAAAIMALYLVSAVVVATLLVPHAEFAPGGAAEHRALSYLAHGSALSEESAAPISSIFGEQFGDLFDFSSVIILCLAGVSVTLGLQNLLPHYLHRLGMEMSWAGKVGTILHVLNGIILLVTVVFRASPSAQQWAYATSVMVLLAGASLAAAKDLGHHASAKRHGWRSKLIGAKRSLQIFAASLAGGFFLAMTGLTVLINHSGLVIATAFVVAILVSSFLSRWIRSTELRFEGFGFVDTETQVRWDELCCSGEKVLAPHRPGLTTLAEKAQALQRDYRIRSATPVIFIEAILGDPSNFYQKPLMKIEREGEWEVIRVCKCVSISHVLAAICLELCRDGGQPPEIIFGWSHESPLAANLNFLLLGEGNIPWMVKELVRKAVKDPSRRPRIVIG